MSPESQISGFQDRPLDGSAGYTYEQIIPFRNRLKDYWEKHTMDAALIETAQWACC
jgi:hypothetical protein